MIPAKIRTRATGALFWNAFEDGSPAWLSGSCRPALELEHGEPPYVVPCLLPPHLYAHPSLAEANPTDSHTLQGSYARSSPMNSPSISTTGDEDSSNRATSAPETRGQAGLRITEIMLSALEDPELSEPEVYAAIVAFFDHFEIPIPVGLSVQTMTLAVAQHREQRAQQTYEDELKLLELQARKAIVDEKRRCQIAEIKALKEQAAAARLEIKEIKADTIRLNRASDEWAASQAVMRAESREIEDGIAAQRHAHAEMLRHYQIFPDLDMRDE
ncbi:hypothetical protein PENSPDRAFT_758354 [Peniophora sp. CONT]|nr:hypothetical protein PENSPDRAFT_758354 [Peniophora sp. CONT]